jgi:gas vesicle protein
MVHENQNSSLGTFLSAFVLGAAAGAAVALLVAPRSGRETRAQLKDVALDLRQTMERAPAAIQRAGARAMKAGQAAYEHARGEIAPTTDVS